MSYRLRITTNFHYGFSIKNHFDAVAKAKPTILGFGAFHRTVGSILPQVPTYSAHVSRLSHAHPGKNRMKNSYAIWHGMAAIWQILIFFPLIKKSSGMEKIPQPEKKIPTFGT